MARQLAWQAAYFLDVSVLGNPCRPFFKSQEWHAFALPILALSVIERVENDVWHPQFISRKETGYQMHGIGGSHNPVSTPVRIGVGEISNGRGADEDIG